MNVSVNLATVQTKTYLGEVEDGRRQVYWSTGDAINLNGYESLPLTQEQAGKATADFQLYNGALPYKVIYPASICGEFAADGTVIAVGYCLQYPPATSAPFGTRPRTPAGRALSGNPAYCTRRRDYSA